MGVAQGTPGRAPLAVLVASPAANAGSVSGGGGRFWGFAGGYAEGFAQGDVGGGAVLGAVLVAVPGDCRGLCRGPRLG